MVWLLWRDMGYGLTLPLAGRLLVPQLITPLRNNLKNVLWPVCLPVKTPAKAEVGKSAPDSCSNKLLPLPAITLHQAALG